MKKLTLITLTIAVLAVLAATTAQAGNKVEICHIPPGNPDNFHTITINEKAFSAHLAHGDLGRACNANCDAFCDDGDECTRDHNNHTHHHNDCTRHYDNHTCHHNDCTYRM